MANFTMDILDVVRKRFGEDKTDFLQDALSAFLHALMEAEVSTQAGAGYGERSNDRIAQRNGYRDRRWDTRASCSSFQPEGSSWSTTLASRAAASKLMSLASARSASASWCRALRSRLFVITYSSRKSACTDGLAGSKAGGMRRLVKKYILELLLSA